VKFACQRHRTALEAQKDSKRNRHSSAKMKADAKVKPTELAELRIALQLDTREQERAVLSEMAPLKKLLSDRPTALQIHMKVMKRTCYFQSQTIFYHAITYRAFCLV